MKKDNRTPSQQSDLTLMNARRKEKKALFNSARKPSKTAEWVMLGERWHKWIAEHPESMDIDDFAHANGFAAYTFRKKWCNESEVFRDYIEDAFVKYKLRHNNYLITTDKFAPMIMRERPLYNKDLLEHDLKLKQKEEQQPTTIQVIMEPSKETQIKPAPKKENK